MTTMNSAGGQARRASHLATVAAALTATTGCVLANWAATATRSSTDDTVSVVVAFVASLALVRLSWLSARAGIDLHREASAPASATACELDVSRSGSASAVRDEPRSARHRTASVFLALAALTALGAGSASAAPAPARPAFSTAASLTPAPTQPAAAHEAAAGISPDVMPLPGFSTPAPAPSSVDDVPQPRWTPDPRAASTSLSPLVLGGPGRWDASSDAARVHVVVRGDTLWSIAAARLAPDAPGEEVAAALAGWLEANPDLRSNPNLLDVGQQLIVPSPFATTSGATR